MMFSALRQVSRLIIQFGIKSSLAASGYLNLIMSHVYEKGGLENIVEAQKTVGFRLSLRALPFAGFYRDFSITVDDEIVPPEAVEIKIGHKSFKKGDVVPYLPGEKVEIFVNKMGGLRRGKHRITLAVHLNIGTRSILKGQIEDEVK